MPQPPNAFVSSEEPQTCLRGLFPAMLRDARLLEMDAVNNPGRYTQEIFDLAQKLRAGGRFDELTLQEQAQMNEAAAIYLTTPSKERTKTAAPKPTITTKTPRLSEEARELFFWIDQASSGEPPEPNNPTD